ncbi:MAG: hypothetical protein KC458_03800 [Dehalococcoidia bacterium]|nr:hypothetical protein [Dehalococcoidia bacterium]
MSGTRTGNSIRTLRRGLLPALLVLIAIAALTACDTNATSASPTAAAGDTAQPTPRAEIPSADAAASIETVPVILEEWAVRVPGRVKSGVVTFEIHNSGLISHQLSVFRTDLPPDRLPVVEGEADVTVPEAVASTGEIGPDGRATLTLQLEPGRYVLLSNLPAQYESGMFRPITVQ